MVISLDSEIEFYQPFGRSFINSIPNSKVLNKFSENDGELELNDDFNNEEKLFNDDFVTAELDITRDLFRSLNDVSNIKDKTISTVDFWKVRKSCKGEEEIYVRENVLICSFKPSNNNGTSVLNKSFTFSENIMDVIWCNFVIKNNIDEIVESSVSSNKCESDSMNFSTFRIDHSLIKNSQSVHDGKLIKSLCILDQYSLHIISEDGDHFRKLLQFKINKVFASKFGIIAERFFNQNEAQSKFFNFPSVFFLKNPLSDMLPMLRIKFKNSCFSQSSTKCSTINSNDSLKIIDIIEFDLNLVVFYCEKTNSHVLYSLRHVDSLNINLSDFNKNSESLDKNLSTVPSLNFVSTPVSHETTKKQSTKLSYLDSPVLRNLQQQESFKYNNSSPLTASPSLRNSLTNCDLNQKHVSSSPSVQFQNLISSRVDSPVSPSLNKFHTPTNTHSSVFTSNSIGASDQKSIETYSEFALEFIWSESANPIKKSSAASKVFLTSDFTGQQFLCFLENAQTELSLVSTCFLKFVKLEKAKKTESSTPNLNNGNDVEYLFSLNRVMTVKDVEPLKTLNMIIVLDETNALILYSGIQKVAIVHLHPKVYVSGFYQNNFDSTFDNLSNDGIFHSSKIHASSPIRNQKDYSKSFHEIEKGSSNNLSFFANQCSEKIIELRDSIDNRVTIKTQNSKMFRLSFPLLSSQFLVKKCLSALCETLPKEIAIKFIISWYTYRNSTNLEESVPEIVLFKISLFSSIGFDNEAIEQFFSNTKATVEESEMNKKLKIEEAGTDEDWFNLFKDDKQFLSLNSIIKNEKRVSENSKRPEIRKISCNSSTSSNLNVTNSKKNAFLSQNTDCFGPGFLFPYMPHILYSLHLLYEDFKLIQVNWPLCKSIVDILYLLAINLEKPGYQDHYYRDFPSVCSEILNQAHSKIADYKEKIILPSYFEMKPPSIHETLYNLQTKNFAKKVFEEIHFPFIACNENFSKSIDSESNSFITPNIFNLILLYSNLFGAEFIHPQLVLRCIDKNFSFVSHDFDQTQSSYNLIKILSEISDSKERVLHLMSVLGITKEYIKRIPLGIALPLWDIISHFQNSPKNDWSSSIYSLIDRPDLLSLEHQFYFFNHSTECDEKTYFLSEELDYLDHQVLRLLFPEDQRLEEAYRMLMSCKPIIINLKQEQGMSDSDFSEEQEKHLLALSVRTMALPLGRGMITLRSHTPIVVERFPIPPLVLNGKVPPRHIINLNHIDVNMNIWPLFHNGVSAGLRISANPSKLVDSSWILFNKPSNSSSADDHYEHAGFLLALGLNGLLDNLSIMDLHDYLSKGNDLTKVAILLGLAASRRGTMDSMAFVLLGIHLEGLLPSTSTELDVSPIVKVAAVLGTGFLFQGTGHRYISEVMLNEIGRPPGPEMDHYIDRESYALSAGLAFGLVTLGRGIELMNVVTSEGISIPDQLNHYMLGVHKKISTIQKEKTKTPSYHIREGNCINADVTSPGATLALGMMFFNTGNQAIVQWLTVPDTQNLLEMVRPDFLLLRVLAKNLILWADIKPTSQWIESHIPPIVYKHAFQKNGKFTEVTLENEMLFSDHIDYETMTQSYCNIIAGACFALALRFAGSANDKAFDVVIQYLYKFVTLIQKGSSRQIEQAGRSTVECCLNVLIVSSAIIMAGTGNVEIMRICRFLRSRVNQSHVLHGSFMAIHMALGLIFLGGCRMTLSSSPESVAALICSFFPKYPTHTHDNRYHLQAFRHLYVLAVEKRLLIPRCIDTGVPLYAKIRFDFLDKSAKFVEKLAPCFLPDLKLLSNVELTDNNFWQISFQSDKNFEKLRECLKLNGNLYIKRKIKCLSYNKDNLFIRKNLKNSPFSTIENDQKSFTLFDFTNEILLKEFKEVFSYYSASEEELQMKRDICTVLYECAEDETLELFVPMVQLISSCYSMFDDCKNFLDQLFVESSCSVFHRYFNLWQIKFASLFIKSRVGAKVSKYTLLQTIKFKIEERIREKFSLTYQNLLLYLNDKLLITQLDESSIDAIVYYNLPFKNPSIENCSNFLSLWQSLKTSSDLSTILFIRSIFNFKN